MVVLCEREKERKRVVVLREIEKERGWLYCVSEREVAERDRERERMVILSVLEREVVPS